MEPADLASNGVCRPAGDWHRANRVNGQGVRDAAQALAAENRPDPAGRLSRSGPVSRELNRPNHGVMFRGGMDGTKLARASARPHDEFLDAVDD